MPSGIVHSATSCMAAGMVGVGLAAFNAPPESVLLVPVGCLTGILLTPDLDQETLTFVEYKIMNQHNRLLALGGWLFTFAFLPYAWTIPHRHWLSHGLIVSTFIRLLYLTAIVAIPAWFALGVDIVPFAVRVVSSQQFVYFLTGLLISDTLHIVMDLASTGLKRKFNRRKRSGKSARITR